MTCVQLVPPARFAACTRMMKTTSSGQDGREAEEEALAGPLVSIEHRIERRQAEKTGIRERAGV